MRCFFLALGLLLFSVPSAFAVDVHDDGKTKVKTLEEIQAELLAKIESGELKVNPLITDDRRRANTRIRDNYRKGGRKESRVQINQNRRPRYTRRVNRLYNNRGETSSVRDVRPKRTYSRSIFPFKKHNVSVE